MKQGMAGVIVFPIALCVLLSGMGIGFLGISAGGLATPDDIVTALTPHAPIRIDGDGDFPGIATAGDGSAGNPWIIENLDVDDWASGLGYAIYVGNTTEHFEIRNCTARRVADSGDFTDYFFNSGIILNKVSNGTIHNCSTYLNYYSGMVIRHCENLRITNNSVSNNTFDGINFVSNNSFIQNNSIFKVDVEDVNGFGLRINGLNNTVLNNTMINMGIMMGGATIDHWTSHNILNNTVNGKPLVFSKNQDNITLTD